MLNTLSMAHSLTIGILVTNTDTSPFTNNYPEDGLKFTSLLKAARPSWNTKIYQVKDGEFPTRLDECDGYLIGGSPASVNGDAPWVAQLFDLIRNAHAEEIPLAGMCFGHQAIAKALGGEVGKNPGGWGWGVAETKFSVVKPWMEPAQEVISLFAAHTEQVLKLPAGAEVLGGSDFCPIGSYSIGNKVFCTEYHPEIWGAFFKDVTEAFASYIGEDVAARGLAAVDKKTDNALYMEWVAKFFERANKRLRP